MCWVSVTCTSPTSGSRRTTAASPAQRLCAMPCACTWAELSIESRSAVICIALDGPPLPRPAGGTISRWAYLAYEDEREGSPGCLCASRSRKGIAQPDCVCHAEKHARINLRDEDGENLAATPSTQTRRELRGEVVTFSGGYRHRRVIRSSPATCRDAPRELRG